MPVATAVVDTADRLGLDIAPTCPSFDAVTIERRGRSVELDAVDLVADHTPRMGLVQATWMLMGVRLGIDKITAETDDDTDRPSPMKFRRTPLRRYHEAPSVHGDHLLMLIPRVTRQTFEAIADVSAFHRPWLSTGLDVVVVQETGKRLDILTTDEQRDADDTDENRWNKARSALFYQSYKVRPASTSEVSGGRLRWIETGEGFGASRALLLPEFDYDASRDYGYLAVPTRDCIIIARPEHKDSAKAMLPALRSAVDDRVKTSNFALTDAIFELEPDAVHLFEPSSLDLDVDPSVRSRILSIRPT